MTRTGMPLLMLMLVSVVSLSQQPPPKTPASPAQVIPVPHVFNITPKQKARKNPVPFTDVAVEQGKKLYESQCAMCHGSNGKGDGDLARALKIAPPDFTKPSVLAKRTDGELFTIIGEGTTPMPGQKHRMSDLQRWELVDFLRSLQGKTPRPATPAERQLLKHEVVVHP